MATINDLVLVHIDRKPGFFARIEEIAPDAKPGWWQVKLLVLSFPLQIFTWILDAGQIDGAPFTMSGTPVRLEKIVAPEPHQEGSDLPTVVKEVPAGREKKARPKVVSLADRKKK
jgi:hypothetical protein